MNPMFGSATADLTQPTAEAGELPTWLRVTAAYESGELSVMNPGEKKL